MRIDPKRTIIWLLFSKPKSLCVTFIEGQEKWLTRTWTAQSASNWCCRGPCLQCAKQRLSSTCQNTSMECWHPQWRSHIPAPPYPAVCLDGRCSILQCSGEHAIMNIKYKGTCTLHFHQSINFHQWPPDGAVVILLTENDFESYTNSSKNLEI